MSVLSNLKMSVSPAFWRTMRSGIDSGAEHERRGIAASRGLAGRSVWSSACRGCLRVARFEAAPGLSFASRFETWRRDGFDCEAPWSAEQPAQAGSAATSGAGGFRADPAGNSVRRGISRRGEISRLVGRRVIGRRPVMSPIGRRRGAGQRPKRHRDNRRGKTEDRADDAEWPNQRNRRACRIEIIRRWCRGRRRGSGRRRQRGGGLRRCGCWRQHRDRSSDHRNCGRNRQSTNAHESLSESKSVRRAGDLA